MLPFAAFAYKEGTRQMKKEEEEKELGKKVVAATRGGGGEGLATISKSNSKAPLAAGLRHCSGSKVQNQINEKS